MTNPLELRGPEFLQLYFVLLGLAVFAGVILRRMLTTSDPGRAVKSPAALDPYEIAYLRDGPDAAFDVAMIKLSSEGLLEHDNLMRVHVKSTPRRTLTDIERAICNAAKSPISIRVCRNASAVPLARVGASLISRGLINEPASQARAKFISSLPLLAVFLLGLVKIMIGLSRDRPVSILIILSILCLGVLIYFWCWTPPYRTAEGNRVIDQLQLKARQKQSRSADVAESYAILGRPALTAATLGVVGAFLYQPPPARGNMRADGGSYGGSCGGGGGSSCGGGGCGGGGCGGCGG